MASPREKLAASLAVLETLQRRGQVAIPSADLSRANRQRLRQAGFLEEVVKGWYVASRPDDAPGDSTAWFTSYWGFCADYLKARFGADWSLSPEQSLLLHMGDLAVPQRLAVRSPRARNGITPLAHGTAILETRAALPPRPQMQTLEHPTAGVRVFALPAALLAIPPSCYRTRKTEVEAALANIDPGEVLPLLLDGGRTAIAGRIAAGLRHVGHHGAADEILAAMRSAGFDVRERDPFDAPPLAAASREPPWAARLRASWQSMRQAAMAQLPPVPGLPNDASALLRAIDAAHVDDAFHSLSIEGYRVTPQLIERVRTGEWDPHGNPADGAQRDALAARGYYECFVAVKRTIVDICRGKNPGAAFREDHGAWHRALWAPSVRAGIVSPATLAGYRASQVFTRSSRHVPPRHSALRDLMPALFDLLEAEPSAAVRAVLGHFAFVYIHPYMDGNGRLARFLMNAMLASGGYAWCVVPVERRTEYMLALETGSVGADIGPFARFLDTPTSPFDAVL